MFSNESDEHSTPRRMPSQRKPAKSSFGHTPKRNTDRNTGSRRSEKRTPSHGITRITSFDLDVVLKYVGRARQKFYVNGKLYNIAMNNQRMRLIGRTQECACCGAKGKFFWLEQSGASPPFLNLYAEDHTGQNTLLTMDHILPESEGGKAEQSNLQLLCVPCYRKKRNRNISNEELLAERCAEDESLRQYIEQRRAQKEQSR